MSWEKDGEFYYYAYSKNDGKYAERKYNLDLVDDKYRHIVRILLSWEDSLSDGYKDYCEFGASEQAQEYYEGDYVIATLVEIAKEILGENSDNNSIPE